VCICVCVFVCVCVCVCVVVCLSEYLHWRVGFENMCLSGRVYVRASFMPAHYDFGRRTYSEAQNASRNLSN
jgi:hypothetical protein